MGFLMKKIIFIINMFLFASFIIFSYEEEGTASWYGPDFHGKKTANGETFNTYTLTAAHRTLPFGSLVKVVSLENDKEIVVRINDRGPFKKNRIIDLSMAAAQELGVLKNGTMNVKLILLEEGQNTYHRYKKDQTYNIQIASFSNEESAFKLADSLKEKGMEVSIQKVELDKTYHRVIIENLNYAEVQLYRVKLQEQGIEKYLVVKNI
jgi:rare lipoprotein A